MLPDNAYLFIKSGTDYFQLITVLDPKDPPTNFAQVACIPAGSELTGYVMLYQHVVIRQTAALHDTSEPALALALHAKAALPAKLKEYLGTLVEGYSLKISFHGPHFDHKGMRWRGQTFKYATAQ